MSTRGLWGVRKDGQEKLTYNHCDSYPDGLGDTIKGFVANHSVKDLKKMFDRIIVVNRKKKATKKQIEECEQWCDLSVSNRTETEWYCLLRNSQGEPEAYMKGLRYLIDDKEFIKDSLMCEYAYIINLDTEKLECYEGFQKEPNNNRYTVKTPDEQGYYNCKLIAEIPLKTLANIDLKKVYKEDDD